MSNALTFSVSANNHLIIEGRLQSQQPQRSTSKPRAPPSASDPFPQAQATFESTPDVKVMSYAQVPPDGKPATSEMVAAQSMSSPPPMCRWGMR